jgi:23S rRNA (adenine2503-C2)-methyltransferase
VTTDPLDILALSREQLTDLVGETHAPYRADQIHRWLYAHGARSWDEMTNVPLDLRKRLSETSRFSRLKDVRSQTAADGTVKTLFELESGRHIETVLIPDIPDDSEPGTANRLTVCVSSQVGCAMACSFCATGQMGFRQNLTSGEIFEQVRLMDLTARERYGRGVSNIVFMGMGEPLLNYDAVLDAVNKLTADDGLGLAARRITISTVGLAGRIERLATDNPRVNLAVSLHAPTDEKRSGIMPVNRKARTDLTALRRAVEIYTAATGRLVTYEYCMFEGFNDSVADADALADVVSWAPSKVNLIMLNPVRGLGFTRTPENTLNAFIRRLVEQGVTVTVRRSRGQDIDAACGQLAVEEELTP